MIDSPYVAISKMPATTLAGMAAKADIMFKGGLLDQLEGCPADQRFVRTMIADLGRLAGGDNG